jgi:hypothetical protein
MPCPVCICGDPMRLTLLLLCLTTTPALADPRLAGEYRGIIASGGQDEPGITILSVGADGAITGQYDFVDLGQTATGTLDQCRFSAPMLSCRWSDRYGSGAWVVEVAPDFAEFRGSWYDATVPLPHNTPEGGYLWTGRKPSLPPQS